MLITIHSGRRRARDGSDVLIYYSQDGSKEQNNILHLISVKSNNQSRFFAFHVFMVILRPGEVLTKIKLLLRTLAGNS